MCNVYFLIPGPKQVSVEAGVLPYTPVLGVEVMDTGAIFFVLG